MIWFHCLLFYSTLLFLGSHANSLPRENLQARTFGEALTWDKAKGKGKQLDTQMNAASAVASAFTKYEDLATWGWKDKVRKLDVTSSMFNFLKKAPYLFEFAQSQRIRWIHDRTVIVDGLEYGDTGGYFQNIYNVLDMAIIADDNDSPENSYDQCPDDIVHLVKLKKWSDVTFLEWQHLCSNDGLSPSRLKWVIRSKINSYDTLSIIEDAFDEKSGFEDWKKYENGVSFNRGTDNFNALLGTPNASGTAYMLIQHRAQLGKKRVSKITVFGQKTAANEWMPGMLMELEDC
ncbi:hypothetical protein N7495_001206 [Penicillium taxi]|uniref:uncharacterized protein n=1 Tax=Penicillium taxi TaxID=168475 RepID=UPI00254542A7|nr:uncharacterized protein N7495_001206 [Penicillium taxi]KAJ5908524.1 hypothetical protein N7495_001206 [Penicillium taxi]